MDNKATPELVEAFVQRGRDAAREEIGVTDYKAILASAPSLHDVLARPMVYEAWLKKAQEAVNG